MYDPSSTALLNVAPIVPLEARTGEYETLVLSDNQPSSLHRASAGSEKVFNLFLGGRQPLLMGEIDSCLEKLSIRLNTVGERISTKNLACLCQILGPEH